MRKVGKIILWIVTCLLLLIMFGAWSADDKASAILLLFAAVVISPVPFFQELKKKIKGGSALSFVLAFVLFIGALSLTGTSSREAEKALTNYYETIQVTTPSPNLIVEPELTSEPISEPTPELTSEPTPEPTPEPVPESSTFSIHFIDVGQADAALVECDGHYMLIDGGNKEDSNVIYSVLKNASVSKLDLVVGTHAHEDHIGGLPGAFNYTNADITLCPVTSYDSEAFRDFAKYAENITIPSVGDTYSLASAKITILGVNSGSDTNDTSIILRIDYGQTSFLFTGDAEYASEQDVLNRNEADLDVTVLKVGHHGSDTSTSYQFLNAIMPQYAIISVGEGNSYSHPTDAVLSRLRDADVMVYRTDLQGDIYLTSDGTTVSITTEKQASEKDVMTAPGIIVSTPTPTPTPEVTEDLYVVNKNTGKFHEPWCSSADDIAEWNRWEYTGTNQELQNMGYIPCKRCDP